MKPLISCIIPVYNGERFLGEAIESIFSQSYRPIEVIVIDDGSSDGTARVAREYPQPIVYIHQTNQGSPRARNRGIQAAGGDLIAFLDADDLWRAHKLSVQMARFEARADLDFCVSHIQNFWMPELADEEARLGDHPKTQPLPGYISGTLLAKRSAFEKVGLFSSELDHGDSLDWFLRAREKGAAGEVITEVLVNRRMHSGNISRLRQQHSRNEFLTILKRSLDKRRSQERAPKTP